MSVKRRILITGMSGLIGGIARRELESGYQLRALNRSAMPDVDCHSADIGDLDAILPAFEGVDTVIHLAAHVAMDAPWEAVLHSNVIGTYNVFEASRRLGVRRVLFASAGAAISGWELEMPYGALVEGRYDEVPETWDMVTSEVPVRPTGLYGCSKAWGEALARHFVDSAGLSIICLRICAVTAENRPMRPRDFSIWCSHGDLGRMIRLCVEIDDDVRFDTFFALSDNKWAYRDLQHARDVLGYVPRDRAEDYR